MSINGRSVHYLESGADAAPTIVTIHGAGGRADLWPHCLRTLPGCRTLAIDLPGHGASAPPSRRRAVDYARVVADLLKALSVTNAIWVGHSLGGAIALEAAASGLAPVGGLVLLGCAATMRVGSSLFGLLHDDYVKAVEVILDYGLNPTAPPATREACREALLATAPMTTYGDFLACHQLDLRPRLAEIRRPALIISGTADRLVAHRFAAALAEGLPQAELQTLDGASHFALLEQPETIAAAISAFVAAHPTLAEQ